MAEQMRPSSKENAPDPANSYERTNPGREAGMGRMDAPKSTPADAPDSGKQAVTNEQNPARQVNAQDAGARGSVGQQQQVQQHLPPQPDHSMKDEEPLGWDQTPTGTQDAEQKRHPRTEGKGGVE
jgi:hypothetical protein